jgi:hypothetical protein
MGLAICASLGLAAAACIGDKTEYLQVESPLAVGSYGGLLFGDMCPGSKADLCSNDTVQSIDAFTVDPPGALEILPASAVPSDLLAVWLYSGAYVLQGLAPGDVTVCVKAHYSDGSDRKACQPVTVKAIAHVAASLQCDPAVDGAKPGPLVPPGTTLPFNIELFAADGSQVSGALLHPIDETQLTVGLGSYRWMSPAAGGTLTLSSPLDPAFAETLGTYGPTEVDGVFAAGDLVPPTILTPGRQQWIQVAANVGGVRACVGLPVSAKTETPDVCLGPNGELAWSEVAGSITSFTAVTEGSCRLSVGVTGGSGYPGTLTVPYYFVNAADKGRDAVIDDSCTTVGLQTCEAARNAILVCSPAKRWVVASSCNGALCDYTAPGASCTAAHGCVACR